MIPQQVDHIGRLYTLMQLISDKGYDFIKTQKYKLKDYNCEYNKLRYLIAAFDALKCFKMPDAPAYSYGSFRLKALALPGTAITITVYVDGVQIGTSTTTIANIYTDIVTAINNTSSNPDYTAKFDGIDKIYITASALGEDANNKKITVLLSDPTLMQVLDNTEFKWGHDDYPEDYNCLTQEDVSKMWDYIGIIGDITLPPYGSNWIVPNVTPTTTDYYILMEDGSYILQEDGTLIILE